MRVFLHSLVLQLSTIAHPVHRGFGPLEATPETPQPAHGQLRATVGLESTRHTGTTLPPEISSISIRTKSAA